MWIKCILWGCKSSNDKSHKCIHAIRIQMKSFTWNQSKNIFAFSLSLHCVNIMVNVELSFIYSCSLLHYDELMSFTRKMCLIKDEIVKWLHQRINNVFNESYWRFSHPFMLLWTLLYSIIRWILWFYSCVIDVFQCLWNGIFDIVL